MTGITGNDITKFLSGRIRLARNISNTPFPVRMTKEQAREVIKKVWDAVSSSSLAPHLKLIKTEEADSTELMSLSERHLVSLDFLKGDLPRAVILSDDETISIMINEEDHIRIQVFTSGSLSEAYDTADKIDTLLSEKLDIAFDEKFGFLTACPTNAGTGMRAGYMLHLPAITITNSISSVLAWASKLGLAVRGFYGEGSKAQGCFYQLSNQVTLGATERDITARLDSAANELSEKERYLRRSLYENNTVRITDKCMRSYGILSNAYSLSSEEAFSLVSDVELGISLGIIKNTDPSRLVNLLFDSLPASISMAHGGSVDSSERDVLRAEFFRNSLRKDDEQ